MEHQGNSVFCRKCQYHFGDRKNCRVKDLVNSNDIYLPSLFLVDQQEAVVSHPYNHHVRRDGDKALVLRVRVAREKKQIDENETDKQQRRRTTNDRIEKISRKNDERERKLSTLIQKNCFFFFAQGKRR